MNKINFFEQNIETGLTKSHSRPRKNIPEIFFFFNFPDFFRKKQNCPEFP